MYLVDPVTFDLRPIDFTGADFAGGRKSLEVIDNHQLVH
jgi:hypothetical protein